MADEWETFLERAKLVALKSVLGRLQLPTSGNKATLKVRIIDAVQDFSDVQRLELIPVPALDAQNGEPDDEDNDDNENDEDHDESDSDDVNGSSSDVSAGNVDENIDRELENLRNIVAKKKEISKLKKELKKLKLEDIQVISRSPGYTFKDLEDAIPNFSGDDNLSINRWIELFEESSEIMEFDSRTKFIFAKRLRTGTARILIRTLNLKSWKDLKCALKAEFEKHVTKADLHNELRNRRKKKDETMQQYVLVMQEIASAGHLDEEDLMQYIIKGIQDSENNKMLLYSANNLKELKIALRKYEKLKKNSYDNVLYKKSDTFENKPLQKSISKIKCFKCKEVGHISKYCTKLKTKARSDKPSMSSNNVTQHPLNFISSKNNENESADVVQQPNKLNINYTSNKFQHVVNYVFYKDDFQCTSSLLSLLDSGSPISFVQQQFVPASVMTSTRSSHQQFCGINGSPLAIVGMVDCNITYNNTLINLDLFVVKNESMYHSVILGRNFMEKCNLVLQKNNTVHTGTISSADDVQSLIHASHPENAKAYDKEEEEEFLHQVLNINVSSEIYEINLKLNEKLPFHVKVKVEDMIKQVWFRSTNISEASNIDFEMNIRVTKEDPFFCAPRRLPYHHKIELQIFLDNLLSKSVIRESVSPFASPIVLVKKKNGELRLCVDYRELNKVTMRDNYPLPLIEDHLDRLRNKRYFTTLDLKNGFHHVKIADESIKYTSFITPLGQFEYMRMPFGLKNAPSVFERFMKRIFGKLLQTGKVLSFIDDILIATESKSI